MEYQVKYWKHVVSHSATFIITHYKQVLFLRVLKLHFKRKETNQYDKLQAYNIIKGFSKALKKAMHNSCIQTTHWSMNSLVLGKGCQQKLLPSD